MRSKLHAFANGAAILALILPTALAAQGDVPAMLWSARNDGWAAIRTQQGCYAIFYKDMVVLGYGGYEAAALDVFADGGCGPDGLAEGPLRLQFTWARPGDGRHMLHQVDGNARHGVFEGDAEESDGIDPDGAGYRLLDVSPNPLKVKFAGGCIKSYDPGDGNYVPSEPDGCDPAGAPPMIEQLRMAGLLGQGAVQGAAGGAPPPPDPAPPRPKTAAEMGDVFDRCVELHDDENIGLYDDWSLANRCGETVIARYCFESDPPGISEYAQCSQGDYRTTEIRANDKVSFQYGLTDWGKAELKTLRAVGYACTDGRFPDVFFDGGRLKFLGC